MATSFQGAIIDNMDWVLLRQQKAHLIAEAQKAGGESGELFMGVIHLIDAIQDGAVSNQLANEQEVFGNSQDI